ncbi:uncharacterized protein DFL_002067 [Arthrobotrys flagrans]|uniref:Uncharacterized protein n=1 Tax=Arthrobotrys flagrans TaxID=97331 RepID=A0A437A9G2_ARTFL|nr:hypothetical protein DFL_002067 [Arthrobotrys flagrans]
MIEVILTAETFIGTVTVNCNGIPIGTSFAASDNTSTEPPGVATETVIETVVANDLTRPQTILSTTTIIDYATTTVLGAATNVAISAGVLFALNIFGPSDISLAAIVDSTGAVDFIDASIVTGDVTPVHIDDSGFIHLILRIMFSTSLT